MTRLPSGTALPTELPAHGEDKNVCSLSRLYANANPTVDGELNIVHRTAYFAVHPCYSVSLPVELIPCSTSVLQAETLPSPRRASVDTADGSSVCGCRVSSICRFSSEFRPKF